MINRIAIEGTITHLHVRDDNFVESGWDKAYQVEGIDDGCCFRLRRETMKLIDQPEVTRVLNKIMVILAEPVS